ncbi:MAG TPA: ribosome maturation factor RimM [Candidatus Angelobacter sp.]|jgi:16S rRNA processing protein RimM|nr:ribosome maturation factor RimM [Candidatus Angelobacter sp.]
MNGADQAEFITLARVTKTQGRKGEVAAALFTDFPERFASRRQLFGLDGKGQRHELELEDHWPHKGQVVLKFAGVDSISQAETLIGWEIQLPSSQRAPLEADQVYISDLKGCTVYDGGRVIGKVEDVLFGSGEAPLLVVRDEIRQEHLVPFAASYIEEFVLDQKQVRMKLPDGLLDLDSSLKKDATPKRKTGTEPRQL